MSCHVKMYTNTLNAHMINLKSPSPFKKKNDLKDNKSQPAYLLLINCLIDDLMKITIIILFNIYIFHTDIIMNGKSFWTLYFIHQII